MFDAAGVPLYRPGANTGGADDYVWYSALIVT